MTDTFTKYVILADDDGREHVTLFSGKLQHRSMVPTGAKPVSAGFVLFYGGAVVVPEIGSTSLNLDPRPQDQSLITTFLCLNPK